MVTLGSFSNDHGDGNENVKTAIDLYDQNNTFARDVFLYISSPLAARLRRENGTVT